ncbi:MAG: ABC transporter permease [bacterium]|nr:ABC transporter permease [bacterium]
MSHRSTSEAAPGAPAITVTVIEPPRGLLNLGARELWRFRELAYFFVWRDLKVRYKQTVIGALWAVIQPFVAMVVFTVFFGVFAQIPSNGTPYPVFVYTGLVFWNYFSFGLSHASSSMIENGNIIRKIYFPRLIIPIASSLTGLIDFAFALLVLGGILVYYRIMPSLAMIAYLPILLSITFCASVGIGSFFAAINVKYRDVRYAMPFVIQMLLFVTPVIYPASMIGERYRWILMLNPMASVIETARVLLTRDGHISFASLGIACAVSAVCLVLGIGYFRKTEQFFADLI